MLEFLEKEKIISSDSKNQLHLITTLGDTDIEGYNLAKDFIVNTYYYEKSRKSISPGNRS